MREDVIVKNVKEAADEFNKALQLAADAGIEARVTVMSVYKGGAQVKAASVEVRMSKSL